MGIPIRNKKRRESTQRRTRINAHANIENITIAHSKIVQLLYMAAVHETWRSLLSYDLCIMRSKRGFHPHRRTEPQDGWQKSQWQTLYRICSIGQRIICGWHAAIPFTSGLDAEIFTPLLMEHFRRWGLEVHAGSYSPHKDSKIEMLFCARPLWTYQ